MDIRKEMKKIQRRRKSRKRKKIIVRAILISVIAMALIFVIYIAAGQRNNSNISDVKSDTMITNSTPAVVSEQATFAPTPEITPEPTNQPIKRRGDRQPIPEDIKEIMQGNSMPQNASVTFDDLAYLTIPHYDFNYNVTEGHMVVNAGLADETLDIFAELFDIQYPIECMQLVDYYNADDFLSIENNNTSAFNYRESTDGSGRLSKHALGCAIDINPQINPYVRSEGTGSHQNASEYWSRDVSAWSSEIAKAAYIGVNTDIYKIFVNKYGWEWGGSWSSYRDYQHFQKSP